MVVELVETTNKYVIPNLFRDLIDIFGFDLRNFYKKTALPSDSAVLIFIVGNFFYFLLHK